MLNKRGLFLLLILLLPVVYAQGYTQSEYVTVGVNLDANVVMNYETTNAKLQNFEADLGFFPRNYLNQKVLSFNTFTDPYASIEEGSNINYKWNNNVKSFSYGFDSKVRVKNFIVKIDKEIKFPITGLEEEDLVFTQATEYVDISPQIRDKANEIVTGEDDFFKVVVKLAEWTRTNIEYNLNTLTDSVVRKSSWVFAAREGVCDEITNLFVSFLRSLNVPVKYISGMAYSNVIDGWGPHAWAEVYFPDYGWLPFDVTFGQYGWIDPSHVKMIEGKDAKEPSVVYNWKAINVGIADKEFNISADLVESGENVNPLVKLEIVPIKNNIAGGSYVPVRVKVKNLQNSYLSTLVFFNIAPNIINGNEKAVLLKPNQEKSLYWILNVDKVSDKNNYVSLLEVMDSFGAKADGKLEFAKVGEIISQEDAEKIIKGLEETEEKKYKYDLNMDCSLDKSAYYIYESAIVNCNLKNTGNAPLNFNLCLDKYCEKINLSIAEGKANSFVLDLEDKKSQILNVEVKGENIELDSVLDLKIFDEPKVEILSLNYDSVKYNEEGAYEFILEVNPEVYDLSIKISGSRILTRDKYFGKQRFSLPFKAWRIGAGEQEINVVISYKDKNGKIYGFEKKYKIEVQDINTWDKFLVHFRDLTNFV